MPRPLRGEIRFESVSFRYPTSTGWALQDVTLHIPVGSSLALVGATGSGKSTLVQLIGRFYDPTAGRVLIDGHDVRTLDLAELRRQIGVVMCSRPPSPRTSPLAGPTPRARPSSAPSGWPKPTSSSPSCPRATTR